MGLESSFNFIDDLNTTNPAAGDNVSQGDDHLRGIKSAVKGSFTSLGSTAVTKTAAEINDLATLTGTETLTNKTLTAPVINGAVTGTAPKVLLNEKIVEIGDWNMDSTNFVQVAHGLTFSKIRHVSVAILIDDDIGDTLYIPSESDDISQISCGTTNVSITRTTGGTFDTTNFDKTSFNRGYITILYTD